jgi:NMD protein affecting ribosome stability and mRNA decay
MQLGFHCTRCGKRVRPETANVIYKSHPTTGAPLEILAIYCWECDIAAGRRKPWRRLADVLLE